MPVCSLSFIFVYVLMALHDSYTKQKGNAYKLFVVIMSLVILNLLQISDTSSIVQLSLCCIRISVKPKAICVAFSVSLPVSVLVN